MPACRCPAACSLGLGVNVPFGLETNYPDDWVGRYHAVKSELEDGQHQPRLRLAADQVAVLPASVFRPSMPTARSATRSTSAPSVPPPASRARLPAQQDGFARLHGDDWAYGWNAGLIVEPVAGTRLGVAYRSEIDHTLRGDVDFTGDDAGIANIIRRSTGAFTDTDASLGLTTPASLSFGVHQDVTPRLARAWREAQWTDWSVFDQLTVKFDNPDQPDSVTEEEWHDAWFLALGSPTRPPTS